VTAAEAAQAEATDDYVVRHTPAFNNRTPWTLFVVLTNGLEDKLSSFATRSKALTHGRMLAGWQGSCVSKAVPKGA
jgi:hypothetical protein